MNKLYTSITSKILCLNLLKCFNPNWTSLNSLYAKKIKFILEIWLKGTSNYFER